MSRQNRKWPKAQVAGKPTKGKAMSKVQQQDPPEYFIEQFMAAHAAIETPEVSHHRWLKLTGDHKFGPELEYVRRRVFHRKPYCHRDEKAQSIRGMGSYYQSMTDDFVRQSVTITRISNEILGLRPLALSSNVFNQWRHDQALTTGAICREFWLMNEFGSNSLDIECLEGYDEIAYRGESLRHYLQKITSGICNIDSGKSILIIATAGLNYSLRRNFVVKLNLTIVKPESSDAFEE